MTGMVFRVCPTRMPTVQFCGSFWGSLVLMVTCSDHRLGAIFFM